MSRNLHRHCTLQFARRVPRPSRVAVAATLWRTAHFFVAWRATPPVRALVVSVVDVTARRKPANTGSVSMKTESLIAFDANVLSLVNGAGSALLAMHRAFVRKARRLRAA